MITEDLSTYLYGEITPTAQRVPPRRSELVLFRGTVRDWLYHEKGQAFKRMSMAQMVRAVEHGMPYVETFLKARSR